MKSSMETYLFHGDSTIFLRKIIRFYLFSFIREKLTNTNKIQ